LGKLLPKEEDEVEVVQLVGVVLRCPPARWMGFNGGGDGGAPPWLECVCVRERELWSEWE